MIAELEHLDATIRLFDADYQVEAIKPKTFRPPDDWAKRGQMTRRCLDILRMAAEPPYDAKRVGVALRGQRNKGVVASSDGPGQVLVWQVARQLFRLAMTRFSRLSRWQFNFP